MSGQGDPPQNLQFKQLDFFDFELPQSEDGSSKEDKFVLAYDYTFLCAIPPELRRAWAQRYADIIAKDGRLCSVLFSYLRVVGGEHQGFVFGRLLARWQQA